MSDGTGAAPASEKHPSPPVSLTSNEMKTDAHPPIEPPHELEAEDVPTGIDWLMSENGHQLVMKAIEFYASHQGKLQVANVDLEKEKIKLQNGNWRLLMYARVIVFVIALGTGALLAWIGKFDGALGTLIGTLVGYFLARGDRS